MFSIQFPEQLDEAAFLREYWQSKPLFMPGAWPGFVNPLSPEELAGLALDEVFPSRIIEQHSAKRWSVRQGPFSEADFAALEGKRWSLLITDIEKHLPDFGRYVQPFRFIPDWRFDDLMISYAPPGGSVGPHFDDYDVFLIQAQGRRNWKIEGRFRRLPSLEDELIPDAELRLIRQFKTQETYSCEPGDMLYLPPRLGHFGVAESECMTWSVGFKAPNFHELLIDYMHEFEPANEHKRFTDPGLPLQQNPGEITGWQITQLKRWFIQQINENDAQFARWAAKYLSDSPLASEFNIEPEFHGVDFNGQIPIALEAHPFVRFEFIRLNGRVMLYAGGEEFELSLQLAKTLTSKSRMNLSQTKGSDRKQVLELLGRGYLLQTDTRS
jgi:50S ribosomal protein L16 3-hydroxylase